MKLNKLAIKYGTDKKANDGLKAMNNLYGHGYCDVYENIFNDDFKSKANNILEIGVSFGSSIKMWDEYFEGKINIYGIDINEKRFKKSELEKDNIKILIGNQNNTKFLNSINTKFDAIIDDGSHKSSDQLISFNTLYYNNLNDGGYYIIEDLHVAKETIEKLSNFNGKLYVNNKLLVIQKPKTTTSVVTRCWYKNTIPDIRIKLFNELYFPALRNQIDNDFNVVLLVYEHNMKQIISEVDMLGVNVIFSCVNEKDIDDLRHPYNCGSNIQIRIDCDDFVSPEYISTIKDIFKNCKDKNAILNFQPWKYDYFTKEVYPRGRDYNIDKPSMFLSLYQTDPKIGVYKYPHTKFHKYIKKSYYINKKGYCNLVVHSDNTLTTK